MKKIVTFLTVGALLVLPVLALGVVIPPEPGGGITDIGTVITAIVGLVWKVFIAVAVIMFIYAGILFLTAQGDPTKVGTARMAFMWGVVGIAAGILAYSIVAIVNTMISSTS